MHALLTILMLGLLCPFSFPQGQGSSSPDYQIWIDEIDGINRSGEPDLSIKQEQIGALYREYKSLYPEEDLVHARFLHRIAEFYNLQNRLDTAIYLAKRAVGINKTASNREETYLADTYFNLAQYFKLIDLHAESLAYLDSSLLISEELPEKYYVQYRIYEVQAFHHLLVAEYKGAIEVVDYALGLKKEPWQEKFFHPPLLLHKSKALLELGREGEAERCLDEAYQYLGGDLSNENMIKLYMGYGELFYKRKEKEKAEDWFLRAMELSKKNKKNHLFTNALIFLGTIYDELFKEFQKSVDVHLLGISYLGDGGNKVAVAQLYNNLGVSYNEEGRFQKAIECFEKGIEAVTGSVPDYSYTKGKFDHTYPEGLIVRENYILLRNLVESYLSLYHTKCQSELLEKSLSIALIADKTVDLLRWRQSTDDSKLLSRKSAHQFYSMAIQSSYLLNDNDLGFYFIEKSRSVLLADKLNELGARKLLSQDDQRELNLLLYKVKLAESDPKDKGYEAKRNLEEYINKLERKYPDYFEYKYNFNSLSKDDLKKDVLNSDQTYVSYFIDSDVKFGNHVYSIVVNKEGSWFVRTPLSGLENLIYDYNRLLSDFDLFNAGFKEFQHSSSQLYKGFVKPIENHLTDRIIVSMQDKLFPFELLTPDSENPDLFMVYDHIFSYTYSANFISRHSGDRKKISGNLLGVAPLSFDQELAQVDLLGGGNSLDRISAYFPNISILSGPNASKDIFLQELPKYDIINLYTHADASMDEREPFLYLHDDKVSIAQLDEIRDVETKLAVLSACNTGVGKGFKGEGVFSLARGFASVGIPSTLNTLWAVDENATYLLTERFFYHLKKGRELDVALQLAKLDMLTLEDGRYSSPYFWGGYILIGDPNWVIEQKIDRKWFLLIIGIVLFGFGIYLFGSRSSNKGR